MVARLDGSSNLPGSTIMHKPCNESCRVLCFMTCMKLVSEKGMKHKTASLRRCGACIYRTGTNGDHASNLPGLPAGRQAYYTAGRPTIRQTCSATPMKLPFCRTNNVSF